MRWAYGITTVPMRLDNTFRRAVSSLAKAGFHEPHIFIDGYSPEALKVTSDGGVTIRNPPARVFGNWYLTAVELWVKNPEADFYAIFQDDIVCCKDLRMYLDASLKTTGDRYYNLYAAPDNEKHLSQSLNGWHWSNQWGRGALGLVFCREVLLTLLSHKEIVSRPANPQRGWRNVDGAIVTTLAKVNIKEMVHKPSLLQHTGQISAMGNKHHKPSEGFPGENISAMQFL